jgi:hypothetical protein
MEDQMTRTILTLALMLAAGSALALERSPDSRGHIGGERSATSDRGGLSGGNREHGGDRDRSFAAGGGKSYPQRDRSGRAGDRD